jgi:hypothetical protein
VTRSPDSAETYVPRQDNDGARGTRTPDLLGAIKRMTRRHHRHEGPCLLAGYSHTWSPAQARIIGI